MPKYRMYINGNYDGYVEFESEVVIHPETSAEDLERLAEEGYESGTFPTLCAQCSGYRRDFSVALGDEVNVSLDDNKMPLIEVVGE